jgi:hypothetical protein
MLYGFSGLLKVAAGLNGEVLKGMGTINLYRFGDDLLNEHKLGIGYSHKIRYVSIGLQLNYIQYRIEGYGSAGSVSVEFGGVVELLPEIHFGAYIFRPVISNADPDSGGFLPTLLKTGLSYRPVSNLMLNVEYQYYIFTGQYLSFGMEYVAREKIALRTGINLQTLRSTFGIGFCPNRLKIDYAIDLHPLLGLSHEFTAIIIITKK